MPIIIAATAAALVCRPPDVNTTRESMSGGGSISRADVAAVCVESLTAAAAATKTLSVYATKDKLAEGQSLTDEIKRLFSSL